MTITPREKINPRLMKLAMEEANLTEEEVLHLLDNPDWHSKKEKYDCMSQWKLNIDYRFADIWKELPQESRLTAFLIAFLVHGAEF